MIQTVVPVINIDKYLFTFKYFRKTKCVRYFLKPNNFNSRTNTNKVFFPFKSFLRGVFAYNEHSIKYPFDLFITSLIENKYIDIDKYIIDMYDVVTKTNNWFFKEDFVDQPFISTGCATLPYKDNLVDTKKYAKFIFEFHTKLYFRLHNLDLIFLKLADSKEEALIAAISEQLIRGEEHEG